MTSHSHRLATAYHVRVTYFSEMQNGICSLEVSQNTMFVHSISWKDQWRLGEFCAIRLSHFYCSIVFSNIVYTRRFFSIFFSIFFSYINLDFQEMKQKYILSAYHIFHIFYFIYLFHSFHPISRKPHVYQSSNSWFKIFTF